MDIVFAWEYLIFEIPLMLGVVLAAGAALGGDHGSDHGHDVGGAGHDLNHDISHDTGHDAGHDHTALARGSNKMADAALQVSYTRPKLWQGILVLLGLDKLPLTISFMILNLLFGGIGFISNTVLKGWGMSADWYCWLSLGLAAGGSLFLTRFVSAAISRIMPRTESYVIQAADLVGCAGRITLPTDDQYGTAQVHDFRGNLHQIVCKTECGELPKGGEVVVVGYDPEQRIYTVVADTNPLPRL